MRTLLWAALATVVLSAPAYAGQCPMMAGMIEEALATSTADEATRTTVTALLQEGMALHDAGDHAASEAKLAEAMALLGISTQ